MTDEALDWSEGGPRSRRFGDVYFSAVDGLAESRAVFLQGCGLPEAWAGRDRFVIAELGFGTGLNVLAAAELWRRTRRPGARLHIFSIEGFPLGRADAARALAAWPELAALSGPLLDRWPARRGFQRIDLPDGITLDLAVGDAMEALEAWEGAADAWFLDGFAPARNPEMWRDELLALVARRSAPGARAATFTVAGAVRRGLEAAGFTVEKKPGFGRKRERLEARLPGDAHPRGHPRIAVVGAGVAGAALARALKAEGCDPMVFEAVSPGAGASGNPAALVTPRLDAGFGPAARLHAQAFERAVRLYRDSAPEAILAEGALQLERTGRDRGRFARLAAWDDFPSGTLIPRSPGETAALLGEPGAPGSLLLRDALVVDPSAVLGRWLEGVEVRTATVAALDEVEADVVCLAAGPASMRLAASLRLRAVRGQVSWAALDTPGPATAWGGYAVPFGGRLLFGATHDRDDWGAEVRPEDHQRNLASLAAGRPALAGRLGSAALGGRASLRAATPDHQPLAGQVGPGTMVLCGLGGRGFTLAPLLAEEIAARIVGAPRPTPRALAAVVDPNRFVDERA